MNIKTYPYDLLINAAKPLLTFIARFNLSNNLNLTEEQVELTHKRLLNEIHQFQRKLKQQKVDRVKLLAASYCLTSCLDECLMNSSHIDSHSWSKRSLLSISHNETWGGENFYKILHYALQRPKGFMDLIALIRLLLNLGYRGKYYRLAQHGGSWLESIAWPIFPRPTPANELSSFILTLNSKKPYNSKLLIKLVKQAFVVLIIMLLGLMSIYHYQLEKHSQTLLNTLLKEEHSPL